MLHGFTFPVKNYEVFIVTNKKNKTDSLLESILLNLFIPCNPDAKKELSYYIQRATLEEKTINNCLWYSIKTDNSSLLTPENEAKIIYL